MTRKLMVAANWKMNKTTKEAEDFMSKFSDLIKDSKNDIVICPTFTSINVVKKGVEGTNIALGAQNLHQEDSGAFTGEISADMLKDAGCEYVIIGHSERREYSGETDGLVNSKIKKALEKKLKVIFCVGESLEEKEANKTEDKIKQQITEGLKDITSEQMNEIIIAYEPIWAIGTGKTATPEQAEEVHAFIRGILKEVYNEVAETTRILYGGSVKSDNAALLFEKENIDGGLIGGASLDPESFAAICNV